MIRPPARGAPTFWSAVLEGGGGRGALPNRPLGRTLVLSGIVHGALGLGLLVLSLLAIDPVPDPPIVIRFLAAAPLPPILLPLREMRAELTPPPPPSREDEAPPPVPPLVVRQDVVLPPSVESPPEKPDPPMLRAEAEALPIRVPDGEPRLRIHDAAPEVPRRTAPSLDRIGAATLPPAGTGEEPELTFLIPGKSRTRGAGGGVAGAGDGLPPLPGGGAVSGMRGGSGGGPARGWGGDPGLGREGSFTPTGLAAFLRQKYGVVLVEATRLGQRTNEGSRYTMLLPSLSEAYRAVRFGGNLRYAPGDTVESAQVDKDAIAIRYRDGALHVIVPTSDGLVALYVSADRRGPGARSKVDEAERALAALQRLVRGGPPG